MRKDKERMMAERQRGATGNGELNHFQLWERLWVSCAYPGQWSCWRVSRESLLLNTTVELEHSQTDCDRGPRTLNILTPANKKVIHK